MSYLEATHNLYKVAAENPNIGLCCTTTPVWQLPGLTIPKIMLEMNYGCGSTVHPRDLVHQPNILYVGVGGGMELLQFAYFSRKKGGVIGVDIVDEMLDASAVNFKLAEEQNAWFKSDFVTLKKGNAMELPVEDNSIDVAAQNCLFNIFKAEDLKLALKEMYRVLKPHGRLVLSDPICEQGIPTHLQEDDYMRALCLSGALPLSDYIQLLIDAGFGTIEIRAKRPYRILSSNEYKIEDNILIESVEVCAIKDPIPSDGACVFTGRTAIYFGDEAYFDDKKGHILLKNQPISICDKTAKALEDLHRKDIFVSSTTYFYDGGGCC
jgi:SAM-dependent methyltransferase